MKLTPSVVRSDGKTTSSAVVPIGWRLAYRPKPASVMTFVSAPVAVGPILVAVSVVETEISFAISLSLSLTSH